MQEIATASLIVIYVEAIVSIFWIALYIFIVS